MSVETSTGQFDAHRHIRLPERPRNGYGWILFSGDIIAIVIAWYIANRLFFSIPVPTAYFGPNRIPVIEVLSWERVAIIFVVLLWKSVV